MNNFSQQTLNQGANNFRSQFSVPYYNATPTSGLSTSTNNIVWVQGIEGAKAWQLNPNSMIILLDSEVEGKMYIKVSDNIGMSSLRVFNYEEETHDSSHNVTINNDLDLSQYVRKDELKSFIEEVLNEQIVSTASGQSTDETSSKPKVITISKK